MSSNGSNARLDRIEKLIEESERANKEAHARHEKAHARHDREIAEIRVEFNREIAESRAEFKQEMAEHRRQMNADLRKTREYMRRWAALGVQEARNQRKRHLKLDADIGRLVSSHLETEALVKGFIASLKAGGNGGPKAS
jgi:hypothetical protein